MDSLAVNEPVENSLITFVVAALTEGWRLQRTRRASLASRLSRAGRFGLVEHTLLATRAHAVSAVWAHIQLKNSSGI